MNWIERFFKSAKARRRPSPPVAAQWTDASPPPPPTATKAAPRTVKVGVKGQKSGGPVYRYDTKAGKWIGEPPPTFTFGYASEISEDLRAVARKAQAGPPPIITPPTNWTEQYQNGAYRNGYH